MKLSDILNFFFYGTCVFTDESSIRVCKMFRSLWMAGFAALLLGNSYYIYLHGIYNFNAIWLVSSSVLFITLPFSMLYLQNLRLFMIVFTTFSSIVVTGSVMASGGLHSPRLIWLLIPFQAMVMLVGLKEALVVLISAMALIFTYDGLLIGESGPQAFMFKEYLGNLMIYIATSVYFTHVFYKNKKVARSLYDESVGPDNYRYLLHELRAPMAALSSLLNLLSKEYKNQGSFITLVPKIKILENQLRSLLSSPEELGKQKNLHIRKFSIRQLLREVQENALGSATDESVEIEVLIDPKLPVNLEGARFQVQQILVNLLSNALKFSTKDSKVVLEAHQLASHQGWSQVEFLVVDNGRGIPRSKLNTVFQPYYQLEKSDRHRGTGLGLTICKQLTEELGGEISVQSDEGKGATFSLIVALKEMPQQEQIVYQDAAISFVDGLELNALIVDDDQISLLSYLHIIDDMGLDAVTATNCQSAMDIIRNPKSSVDVLVVDLNLDGESGLSLIKSLQNVNEGNPFMLKFILTADYSSGLEKEVKLAGADQLLRKPLDPVALQSAIYADKNKLKSGYLYNRLLKRFPSREYLVEILDRYNEIYEVKVKALEKSIAENDFQQIRAQSHKLWGTLLNFGGEAVGEIAHHLQESEHMTQAERQKCFQELQKELEIFNQELFRMLEAIRPKELTKAA